MADFSTLYNQKLNEKKVEEQKFVQNGIVDQIYNDFIEKYELYCSDPVDGSFKYGAFPQNVNLYALRDSLNTKLKNNGFSSYFEVTYGFLSFAYLDDIKRNAGDSKAGTLHQLCWNKVNEWRKELDELANSVYKSLTKRIEGHNPYNTFKYIINEKIQWGQGDQNQVEFIYPDGNFLSSAKRSQEKLISDVLCELLNEKLRQHGCKQAEFVVQNHTDSITEYLLGKPNLPLPYELIFMIDFKR